jgi:hypothetical protein
MSLDRRVVMKSNLVVASIAFSVFASALHAADNPKPWAKKFTMTKQECYQRRLKFRQEHAIAIPMGGVGGGWSNIQAGWVHAYASGKPSWVSKCRDRYGTLE